MGKEKKRKYLDTKVTMNSSCLIEFEINHCTNLLEDSNKNIKSHCQNEK